MPGSESSERRNRRTLVETSTEMEEEIGDVSGPLKESGSPRRTEGSSNRVNSGYGFSPDFPVRSSGLLSTGKGPRVGSVGPKQECPRHPTYPEVCVVPPPDTRTKVSPGTSFPSSLLPISCRVVPLSC